MHNHRVVVDAIHVGHIRGIPRPAVRRSDYSNRASLSFSKFIFSRYLKVQVDIQGDLVLEGRGLTGGEASPCSI